MDGLAFASQRRLALYSALIFSALTAVAPMGAVASTPPGTLDATFGVDGVTHGAAPSTLASDGIVRQSTGKLVVVGTIGSGLSGTDTPYGFGLTRLMASGVIDTTFGVDGQASTFPSDDGHAFALSAAVQADDKVLVGGSVSSGGYYRADVIRYASSGALDSTFGVSGVAQLTLPTGGFIESIVVQPDGRILLAGGTTASPNQWLLARLTTSGSPDPTFGSNGIVLTGLAANGGYATVLTSDGHIYATNGTVLARFDAAGALDASFGSGGLVTIAFGPDAVDSQPFALAEGPNDSVIVGGAVGGPTGTIRSFALARYAASGVLDPTFGTDGATTTNLGGASDSVVWDLAVDGYGYIIAVGQSDTDLATVRFNADGSLDGTFASGGIARVSYGGPTYPAAVLVQPDSRIVVATSYNGIFPTQAWVVGRYEGTPAAVPGAPTGVAATAGNAEASVTWTAPVSTGGSAITGYTVSSSPGAKTCTTAGTLGCTVGGLTNGTAYTFTVTATNGVGTGPASSPSSSVTPAAVPGAPTGVAATPSGSTIVVTWLAAPSNGTPVTSYTATAAPGGKSCASAGTLSCTISGVPDGSYTGTVRAANTLGPGPASAPSNSVLVDTTAPHVGLPRGTPATGSTIGSTISTRVTWTGSDAGSGVAHYEVWLSTNGASFVLVASPTTATYTRLMIPSSTTTYRFRVRGIDARGNTSAFAYGPTFHLYLVQQSSTAVHYYGTWYAASTSYASGGSYSYTSVAGRYVSYTFTGRSIGVIGAMGTAYGSFKVYVDGSYVTTVSEYATSTRWRRILYAKTWSSSGTHTIKLVCVGTTGHPRIGIDAFARLA